MSELVRKLAQETGVPEPLVREIMLTAPVRYKEFHIVKKSGGLRKISQPAREVKLLQRIATKILLNQLPVHPCATAYRINSGLLNNVKPHAKNSQILKLDLKEFFPSLRLVDWYQYCRRNFMNISSEDITLAGRLFFRKTPKKVSLRLAIGAPSSPSMSNILMYEFDTLVHKYCLTENIVYTRYADDMTFSAPRTGYLVGVIKNVSRIIRKLKSPNLEINSGKTVYATQKYKRSITGLILANNGSITIGRDAKRLTRARVHHAIKGRLTEDEIIKLSGYLSFIMSVEPSFVYTLQVKYGAHQINQILHASLTPKERIE
ncbi:retron St85 family RNA-directed DNA polymerase [Teichococcus deserti]|uniref:retron St85 family RNA-directed DNA polymerase n=1 Tax=Teichococcus deserti TaxID=1817963 RepID=UPI001055F199|nr:retron St85 family RNA-directed DNA polymerase [Pseudoroseomonas deserti]